jgi:hypothetical protein
MEEVDGAVTTQSKRLQSAGSRGGQMATNKGPSPWKLDAPNQFPPGGNIAAFLPTSAQS